MSSRPRSPLVIGIGLAVAAASIEPGCLEQRDDGRASPSETRCTACHGDSERAGDFLQRAAPPNDLDGSLDTGYPGVGAHRIHVYASETHAAVACKQCHVVPEATDSPGHADDARPAELSFGSLAAQDGRTPAYDPVSRRCSDTYCHRNADAVWTEPRSSADACGSCHGLPPPAPHPQSDRCEVCHGQVVDAARRFIQPELHVNGTPDHGDATCSDCHGSATNPAPPVDVGGNTAVSAAGVGAHQVHLQGGSSGRAVPCAECHTVPSSPLSVGHADGLPAEVSLTGVGASDDRSPSWDRATTTCSDTWCHGPSPASVGTSPSWTAASSLGCTSCHGTPPPPPHPQIADCSRCHSPVVAQDDVTIAERDRHVNGVVDVAVDSGCTSCHGSTNPAPPVDLAGGSSTGSPGVGAHQTHLLGTLRSRAVPCTECHRVPASVLDAGHTDTPPPAEVLFSGAAAAYGGTPLYSAGSCQDTSCHGAVFSEGHASGGSNTAPTWTRVDGTQAACGACHALPPPRPHPIADLNPVCSACHENIAADNTTFTRPDLHVDGIVTFLVP